MAQVIRAQQAEQDLLAIWGFIAQDNYEAADHFLDKLENVFRALSDSPKMGRSRSADLLVPNLRSFPVDNYVIFYYVNEGESGGIVIARILHGARDTENLSDV